MKADFAETESPSLADHAIAEALINARDDYVAVFSRDGSIFAMNEAFGRRFGKTPEALLGLNAQDLFECETAELRMPQLEKGCRKEQNVRFDDERQGSF